MTRVAVVGGGIAGLATALRLRERLPRATITVYEGSGALGGKLRTGELAGSPVERGAENFLVRDPDGGESAAVALARRVGLAGELVHPAPRPAALAVGGRLRPVPGGTLVGVPGDLEKVAAVARPAAELDRDAGRPLLEPGRDVAVGALVRRRLGDEVVDRLVDPMLGGVYAGRADGLSLAATMPGLAAAARVRHTLTGAVRAAMAAAPRPPGTPVFATVAGGVSRLVEAVAAASGADLRLGLPVRELSPAPPEAGPGPRWRLVLGATRAPEVVTADAVVLAVPATPAARLLAGVPGDAAAPVGALEYASVALVALALPAAELPDLSGLLVPAAEGMLIKAATFFTTKWPHTRRPDGVALVRASVGRYGEEQALQRPDEDLVDQALKELSGLVGPLPAPVESFVQRWGGALPQYAPGHLERVAAARAALPGTIALAGAAYDGVGIPACVRSGETAADVIAATLEQWAA
ncbi:protoporphyrinogen/coproporphyrinogen oxidase [Rhizomonospora bruguierae]|uniref:protoporphyrinogen/coproporphyrinogen oxidase n=1 Tax=Rhizomonospora bruguierae TaxID=1581705 RepID=UPI001BCB1FBE|nr:FAD-dependent oxidoreductase [Micromonospora sp. NBRC 107566]